MIDKCSWVEAAKTLVVTTLIGVAWAVADGAMAGRAPSALATAVAATSLAYVWLCRTENVLSWPVGIISSVVFGAQTLALGLAGQGWFYLLCYAPSQAVGWAMWVRAPRQAAPPGWMGWGGRAAAVAAIIALTTGIRYAMASGVGGVAWWDSSVAAALFVGTVLLGRRRVEGWMVTAVFVNVSGFFLSWHLGAWALCGLYVLFLANAVVAAACWARAATCPA